jgi:voltage-gated potassium channel
MVIVIIELGAFLVLVAEQSSPDANIKTALDAIWWTYVTITTVGYGDRYPVTTAGRLVGILVLTTGVAVFATFAGYISSKLLGTADEEDEEETPGKEPAADMKGTAGQLAEVRRLMAERERLDAAIAARISDLEGVLRQPAEETLDRQ